MSSRRLGFLIGSLTLALPLAVACSSSSGDDGGGGSGGDRNASTPAGRTMGDLAALGDQFVGPNQEAYDGVALVAESLAASLSAIAPEFSAKQGDGCIPPKYAGITHELDQATGTFVAGDVPGAPVDAARFNLYETNDGNPTNTVIGSLDVSCTGAFPNPASINIVVTVDDVDILGLDVTGGSFYPQGFTAQISGFLATADGNDRINYGNYGFEGGSYISNDITYGGGESVAFDLGDNIVAVARSNVSLDPSFLEDNLYLQVYELWDPSEFQFACPSLSFEADLRSMGGGTLSGPGVFCAPPPLADGYNYHVACYEGTRDGVTVSQAAESCLTDLYFLEPTPLPQGDLNVIQAGTNGLIGMYRAVSGVGQAAGALGSAIAAEMFNQQQF